MGRDSGGRYRNKTDGRFGGMRQHFYLLSWIRTANLYASFVALKKGHFTTCPGKVKRASQLRRTSESDSMKKADLPGRRVAPGNSVLVDSVEAVC